MDSATYEVQLWQLTFDKCHARDVTLVCKQCSYLFVRESLNPNGVCLDDPEILPNYGRNLLLNIIERCLSTGCFNCRDDIEVCVACNATYSLKNDACSLSAPPPRQGLALPSNTTYLNCLDPNCANCGPDHTVCITCDAGYSTLPVPGQCTQSSSVADCTLPMNSDGKLYPSTDRKSIGSILFFTDTTVTARHATSVKSFLSSTPSYNLYHRNGTSPPVPLRVSVQPVYLSPLILLSTLYPVSNQKTAAGEYYIDTLQVSSTVNGCMCTA